MPSSPLRSVRHIALRVGIACGVLAMPVACSGSHARSILFIGNSFTYGQNSIALRYGADRVTDLNGTGMGGVPGLFKTFTEEAGLSYDVAMEAVGGQGLDFHYVRRKRFDRAWDDVVLQDQSTLGRAQPGYAGELVHYSGMLADLFHTRNPQVEVRLTATWGYPEQIANPKSPWFGTSVEKMGANIERAYQTARKASPKIAGIVPVGAAFNRAIAVGFADPSGKDTTPGAGISLWSGDRKHASVYGYYLEALMVFGSLTGHDPLALGAHEKAAEALGIASAEATRMQRIAHDTLASAPRRVSPAMPRPDKASHP